MNSIFPSVNWGTLETDTIGEECLDLANDYLTQHVNTPKRDSSVLNLVLSSEDGMVENVYVNQHLGNSYHNIITWDISLDSTRINVSKFLHAYNKATVDGRDQQKTTHIR